MANRDFIVFDFETGSRNPHTTQPTQIAAIALDGRNLAMKGSFNSEIKPILNDDAAIAAGLDPIEDGALKVTNKNRDDLAKAPTLKSVWKKFCTFVNKYNWKGTPFFAPIPAGYNIIGFDMKIVDRLAKKYGGYDKKEKGNSIFHPRDKIDIMSLVYIWFRYIPEIKSISLDNIRNYLGIDATNAHDAVKDVTDCAEILIRFLKLHKNFVSKIKFKDSFK